MFTTVQRILFSVMKGTGHEVEILGAVVGTLEHLLERRARHHLHTNSQSSVDKLSPAEVDLLDVLLQVLYHVYTCFNENTIGIFTIFSCIFITVDNL